MSSKNFLNKSEPFPFTMTELLKQLDHNQIKQLTEELNQLVPKEEAAVQIEFDDTTGGDDLIANQLGFL